MNCRQLREQLIKDSGHLELVKTVGEDALVDNGANRFLNDGIRWLSMRCNPPVEQVRGLVPLPAGSYSFNGGSVRALQEVWVIDPDTQETTALSSKTYEALQDQYGKTLWNVTPEKPQYYCRSPRLFMGAETAPVPAENMGAWSYLRAAIEEGGALRFYVDPLDPAVNPSPLSFWKFSETSQSLEFRPDPTNVAYNGSQLANTTWNSLIYTYTPPVEGNYSLALNLFADPAGKFKFTLKRLTIAEGEMVEAVPLVDRNGTEVSPFSDGTIAVPMSGSSESISILLNCEVRWGTLVSEDLFVLYAMGAVLGEQTRFDDILVIPPADKAYDLQVVGLAYALSLSADTDHTWWSYNHPSLVLRAARMQMEIELHRNASGAEQFAAAIMPDLDSIHRMLVYERTSGPARHCVMRG
jgi:hypothetical protein